MLLERRRQNDAALGIHLQLIGVGEKLRQVFVLFRVLFERIYPVLHLLDTVTAGTFDGCHVQQRKCNY